MNQLVMINIEIEHVSSFKFHRENINHELTILGIDFSNYAQQHNHEQQDSLARHLLK